jgi:hypothetical protein
MTGAEPARDALRRNLRALFPYLVAAALFIGIGVMQPRFMLNWSPGIALLLAVVWGVPELWRRWRP